MNDRLDIILNAAEEKGFDISICGEYGERGYEVGIDKKAILLSNWNDFDKYPNIMAHIEENYEIEWSDEWIIDYDNDRCYRTSPDSYHWQPSYVWLPDRIIGVDDINKLENDEFKYFLDQADYLNNSDNAVHLDGFEARGQLVASEDARMFESHREPKDIMETAIELYPDADFYFVIEGVEQFGMSFALYVLEEGEW